MATQKPKMYYKVYQQSSRVGGKFYAVPDQSDPIVPQLTMQQIIDYKKLHNYSASQLATLVEEVLSGAAELVGMDGQPRNLSTLMKFEPAIKGTFANTESGVTDQKILVRPRMLKDIKVQIDRAAFEFVNVAESTEPRLRSFAIENTLFDGWTASLFQSGIPLSDGNLTLAGDRLLPDGVTADTAVEIVLVKGATEYHMEIATIESNTCGIWAVIPDTGSTNTAIFSRNPTPFGDGRTPYWVWNDSSHTTQIPVAASQVPPVVAGDIVRCTLTRNRFDNPVETVSTVKEYVLV